MTLRIANRTLHDSLLRPGPNAGAFLCLWPLYSTC